MSLSEGAGSKKLKDKLSGTKSLRVMYVFIGGTLKQNSVQHKIACQVREMRHHGLDARGWFFNTLQDGTGDGAYNEHIDKVAMPAYTKKHRYFQSYYEVQHHFHFVAEYLKIHRDSYDRIFLRHAGNGRGYEEILLAASADTYLYIPSNRIREVFCERKYAKDATIGSALFSWWGYMRFWIREKRLLRAHISKLAGVVTFTPEFGRLIARESNTKPNMIYNRDGADTATVPARACKVRGGEELQLIFLKGSNQEQKWAGLDRLIRSIEARPDLPIRLYITGNADRSPERYGRPFVTLTGRLPYDELEQLIDDVDLGVSNLANYLIHFSETTNLKSRDYYSRGLPFVQSNTMPDIEGTDAAQYYLNVPNDDSLIDMQAIYDFGMRMRADINHPQVMHDFAVKHLDWQVTVGELVAHID